MLPYLAQGANSSLEDGAVLGSLLGHLPSKAALPQALRLYESLRKARGEAIVKETFKQVFLLNLFLIDAYSHDVTKMANVQRHDFHLPDGEEQQKRDAVFRSQLGKEEIEGAFPSRWFVSRSVL